MRPEPAIESLRAQIEKIQGRSRRAKSVLPFGITEVDSRLPGGGLALGALHEIAGGGNGAVDGAAAASFSAGLAARTKGKILWCITRADLFAPAIAQAGFASDRVIYLDADTVACRDISELHDTALDGRPLAAVPDYNLFHFELHNPIPIRDRFGASLLYLKEELGIAYRGAGDYFNSGVLLLDLAAWRRLRLAEACHAFIRGRRLQWPDQDALNVVVGSDYVALDARWNTMAPALDGMAVPMTPAQAMLRERWSTDPWIVHYTGTRKPWLFSPRPVAHGDRFWRAAAKSPAGRALKAAYRRQMLGARLGRLAGMFGR